MLPKSAIRAMFRAAGFDLHRYNEQADPAWRRGRLIAHFGIDVVIDVGANTGQFGTELRRAGYRGRIVSFEPLSTAFAALRQRAAGDAAWSVWHCALSDEESAAVLNVAGNSLSSSLLDMLPTHVESAPESRYVATENVTTRRLDALFDSICSAGSRVYLKIDTQGNEEKVLLGAGAALERIDTLQLEMSLVPLYRGERLMPQMMGLLAAQGYELVGLEPGFSDPASGRLLQADGIFHRTRGAPLQQVGTVQMPG